jgi:hypothetical protein
MVKMMHIVVKKGKLGGQINGWAGYVISSFGFS